MNNEAPEWNEFELHLEDCGGYYNEIVIKVTNLDYDEIGSFKTNLMELIQLNANFKLKHQNHRSQQGLLHVIEATPVNVTSDPFHLSNSYSVKFRASFEKKNKKKQSTDDLFLKFYSITPDCNDYVQIGQTDSVIWKDTTIPEWNPFVFNLEALSSIDHPIKIECWNKDSNEYIGMCNMSLREMKCIQNSAGVPLVDENEKKSSYKNSGILEVDSFQIIN